MNHVVLSRWTAFTAALSALILAALLASCSSAAPSPTATTARPAAAAPTKAAEPTKPAAAPTAAPTKAPAPTVAPTAPAKKVDYPGKDKTISFIVGYAPGGATDVSARMLAPLLEKELGVPIQVLNKPGAGTQVGLTELLKSKPDGYTIGQAVLPTNNSTYLDPTRKATYGRKDLLPVANYVVQGSALAVKADSPYKTLKDLVEAAKANPEKIRVSDAGLLTTNHLGVLMLERVAGVKFASVHFEGGAPALTALLGGHVEAQAANASVLLPQVKTGAVRVLGLTQKERDKSFPDVPTFIEQGYQVDISAYYGVIVPTGTPKEIVDILDAAVKKALTNEEFRAKMAELGTTPLYSSSQQFAAEWDRMDESIKPFMGAAQ